MNFIKYWMYMGLGFTVLAFLCIPTASFIAWEPLAVDWPLFFRIVAMGWVLSALNAFMIVKF